MYDLQAIQKSAHVYTYLLQHHPEYFSKVVILPKTNALISLICATQEWQEFKRSSGLKAKDVEAFLRQWKSDIEYGYVVISGKL